uniref:Major facilitator superfamily (MFS) profile domain-containing protein n=1 Tax=Glossina palpalis gambiensis TaxID=67801 RepID=A0A1B0B6K0_9MUSC
MKKSKKEQGEQNKNNFGRQSDIMVTEKLTLTEKNNAHATVYRETTKPKKPKRRDKSDLGPDFVAPDGGWGWVVCLAAGFSNFSIFPALQQYGFIYRKRMKLLGFDAKETTTIVNVVMAISSLAGIVNGAMFRRFTFRQVALVGSMLCFAGIFLSAFCITFFQYVICFSCIYGIGLGLSMGATSLAVNTYFKNRRRRATGFSWTITGLGAIIFPHISTYLLMLYGAQGTILIYAAIALNSVLCAITLQPVLWHVPKPEKHKFLNETNGNLTEKNQQVYECKFCQIQKREKRGIFSSQYLFNDDDPDRPGYEITEPGTPMLARANDGWYGSKLSLTTEKCSRYQASKSLRKTSRTERYENGHNGGMEESNSLYKPNYFNREREDLERYISKISVYSKPDMDECRCTCAEEKILLQKISDDEKKLEEQRLIDALEAEEIEKSKMTFLQKVVKFFDLDLLKDFTFVNLSMGITIMMFGEMNFSVLTPFILNSFGYANEQISLAMSLLGGMDISVRFLAPFALEKVKLDNRVLFAFGIIAISIGRLIVTLTSSYNVVVIVFIMIGFGKGFRTLFSPLILPSYVPLRRLPAASGLQLIFNSIFSFVCGPLLGLVTDAYGYKITIHFINTMTCIALLLWLAESIVRRLLNKKKLAANEG